MRKGQPSSVPTEEWKAEPDHPGYTEESEIHELPADSKTNRDPSHQPLKKGIEVGHDAALLEEVSALQTSEDEKAMTNAIVDAFEGSHDDGRSNDIAAPNDQSVPQRCYPERIRKAPVRFTMNA